MSQSDLIWVTHCSIRSYEYRTVGLKMTLNPTSRVATQQFNPKFSHNFPFLLSSEIFECVNPLGFLLLILRNYRNG